MVDMVEPILCWTGRLTADGDDGDDSRVAFSSSVRCRASVSICSMDRSLLERRFCPVVEFVVACLRVSGEWMLQVVVLSGVWILEVFRAPTDPLSLLLLLVVMSTGSWPLLGPRVVPVVDFRPEPIVEAGDLLVASDLPDTDCLSAISCR